MELDLFRLKVQLEVLRVLLRGLCTGLANSSPSAAEFVRAHFANLRTRHSNLSLHRTDPALSDLFSAEYQEALNDLLSFIESGIITGQKNKSTAE